MKYHKCGLNIKMHWFLQDILDVTNVLKIVRKDDTKAVKGDRKKIVAEKQRREWGKTERQMWAAGPPSGKNGEENDLDQNKNNVKGEEREKTPDQGDSRYGL